MRSYPNNEILILSKFIYYKHGAFRYVEKDYLNSSGPFY